MSDVLRGWLISNDWVLAYGGQEPSLPNLLRIRVGRKPDIDLFLDDLMNKDNDRLKALVPHAIISGELTLDSHGPTPCTIMKRR